MARKQDARKRKAEGKIKRKAKEEEKARERTEKRRKARAAVATDNDESVMCNLCGTTDPSEEVGSDTLWVQCDTCCNWVHLHCSGIEEGKDLGDIPYSCSICMEE